MIIEILKDKTKTCDPYVAYIWTTQTVYISLNKGESWDLLFDGRYISYSKSFSKLLSFAQRLSQLKSQSCNRVTIDYSSMELYSYFENLQNKEAIDL